MSHSNGGWMNSDQLAAERDAAVRIVKDRYDRINNGEPLLSVYLGKTIIEAVNACDADERYLRAEGVIGPLPGN